MNFLILLFVTCFSCQYVSAKESQPRQQSGAIYGGINSNYTYGNNHVTTFVKKQDLDLSNNLFCMQGADYSRVPHSDFGFGFFVGYVHRFSKITLIWDISYDSNTLKQRTDNKAVSVYSPELGDDFSILDPRVDHDYVKFKRDNTWAGTFRIGYPLESSITPFVKASFLYSSFHLEHGSIGLSKNTSKKIMGFEPGVGIDINLQKDFFIRGEYGYQMFKKFASSNLISNQHYPQDAIICSVSPRYHVFRFGVGYKLNIL